MPRLGTALAHHKAAYGKRPAFAHARKPIELSFFNLFWIFTFASVLGLIGETAVATIMDGYLKDRAGLVWGPFSPLYGLGATLMTIALNDLQDRSSALVFAVAAVVGGALEFVAGWFWKSCFGIIAWSYIDRPLNFGGFTCVEMMAVWGLVGLIWLRAGLPLMMRLVELIPHRGRRALTAVAAALMAADIVLTLLCFNFWFERLSGEPVETPAQVFFDEHFGNDFMNARFQTMSMWTDLAKRN